MDNTVQQIRNDFWLEFIEWAKEPLRMEVSEGWEIITTSEKTWRAPIFSDWQAEKVGRLGDSALLRSYRQTYCYVALNENNFWRWYRDIKCV